eukprot:2818941-Rhodomonas_salina.2
MQKLPSVWSGSGVGVFESWELRARFWGAGPGGWTYVEQATPRCGHRTRRSQALLGTCLRSTLQP